MDKELTMEDLKAKNPYELLELISLATFTHTLDDLIKELDILINDKTTKLPPLGLVVSHTSPVSIPFGTLKGREDLGNFGIRVETVLTLEPVRPKHDLEPEPDLDANKNVVG